jgi:hypothetical protein
MMTSSQSRKATGAASNAAQLTRGRHMPRTPLRVAPRTVRAVALALAAVAPLTAAITCTQRGSIAGNSSTPSTATSDQETLDTLQLAYRWGYPLMAMATNNRETYGSTINAFYNMKTAADETSQRDRGFNAEA